MRCEQFETRLQSLLDRRQTPELDERLQRHAARCGDCRALLRAQAELFRELADDSDPTGEGAGLPDDFADAIVAGLPAQDVSPSNSRSRRWTALLVGIAASGLFALWVSREPSPPPSLPPSPPIAAAAPSEPNLTDLPDELRERLPMLLTTIGSDALEPLADGLRPVANSLTVALGALRESIRPDTSVVATSELKSS